MPDASAEFDRPAVYDFDRTVKTQGVGRRDPCFALEPGVASRAWLTAEGEATLTLRCRPDHVEATAWGPGAAAAIAQARRLAGLHDDPSTFRPEHPVVARLVQVHPGVHLSDCGDVYGSLVRVTLQQLVTGPEAVRMWRELVVGAGEPAPGPGGLMLPPAPDVLARAPMWRLQQLGLPTMRANAIKLIGRHANRLNEAYGMTREDRLRRLQAIPGIGPWTAESVLGTHLGDPDAVSPGDIHLPRTVNFALTGNDERVDDAHMLASLEVFRPHRCRVVRLIHAAHLTPPRTSPKRALRKRRV